MVNNLKYEEVKGKLFEINRSLRTERGLYYASLGEHYRNYCWWRDIFYQVLPNLNGNKELYEQTYHTFLDYLHKYKWKITNLKLKYNYYSCVSCLHPRVYPNLNEIEKEWGNTQMDAIMLMLFGLGLGVENGINMFRSDDDREIIQEVIYMYESLEYWKLAGCDAWEENTEVHSHAIGAALAAMTKLKNLGFNVNEEKLYWCQCELNNLLPRESASKDCDLAQLQLIYPLNIVNEEQKKQILHNIETKLVRESGVIRYEGDEYYNVACELSYKQFNSLYHPEWKGWHKLNEMQWTFGFSYLSIIYSKEGNTEKAKEYLDKIILDAGENLMIPEGYYALTKIKNANTPLGWANALTIVAIDELKKIL